MNDEQPPRGRLARLFQAADRRHVPLRTVLVTVAVVVATYLAGKLLYLLRINPLLVFIAVLTGASLGSLIGGIFGGFVAALLAIPTAGALQVLVKEIWQATTPDQPQESPGAGG
jgi:predicted PurR-regulated permease PerM